ncbi:MAG TPA: polysaccharide pyruvyl transferase family protein [Blastocatellia bacterium]|nr:polysaccharide pyruvyl transferase family protein [Blastocatellia bacterium]
MSKKRIALLGLYGGPFREYNPGCFMIGWQTLRELQKRIPDAQFDLYSIDNFAPYSGLQAEEEMGVTLRFFGRHHQIDLLEGDLSSYDLLVVGGDIVWGGVPGLDNDIFLLNSKAFLERSTPAVAFNSVYSFYTSETFGEAREKFANACNRAKYVSVRTMYMKEMMEGHGIENISFVPDPVLALDMSVFDGKEPAVRLPGSSKPRLGISISALSVYELIEALRRVDLSGFDVWLYPYTRQFHTIETVLRVKKAFGSRFNYIERYLDPAESFRLIGQFDTSFNDTLHGTIAAIIQGVSFIVVNSEDVRISRLEHLLSLFGMGGKMMRQGDSFSENAAAWAEALPHFLNNPLRVAEGDLTRVRATIREHFDKIAGLIG